MPQAQKGIAALEPDPGMAAQVMIMQKVISQNGVPAMALASFFYVARPVFGALEALRGVGLPSLSA